MRTVLAAALLVLLPVAAAAQPRAFAVWERPAAGVFVGPSGSGDRNSDEASADVDFVFDTPVVFGYRLRADASRVSWRFVDRNYLGEITASDDVTVKSVRLSLVGVRHASDHVAGAAGAGYGVYRYEYSQRPLRRPWRGGFHGVAGVEVLNDSQRIAIDGEVRLHAIDGTGQPPVFSTALFKLDAAIGVKVRF